MTLLPRCACAFRTSTRVRAAILVAALASSHVAAQVVGCPGRDNFPLYTTSSFHARKVLVSPNGQFVAFSTRTYDGTVVELRVKQLSVASTTAVHQFISSTPWSMDMDFAWSPDSLSIFYTAEPTSGSVVDRGSIRKVTFNPGTGNWGTPVVLMNPNTLTWTSMRLVHTDGTTVWGSFIATSGLGVVFSLTPPPILPTVQPTTITWTTVPNLQWLAHDGIVESGSLRILCSERNTTNNLVQFFRFDSSLSTRTNLGATITQTTENLRFPSWSGTTDEALIVANTRIALHGVTTTNKVLTDANRTAPAAGGALNLYLREVNSTDLRPDIIPTLGGGEIELRDTPANGIWPTVPNAAPSTDANNTIVAWISGGWVYHTILDGELRAFDKAEAGTNLLVTMPVGAGQTGMLAVSFGLTSPPITLSGICSGFFLDTTATTILVSTSTATTQPLLIPSGFAGTELFYQAIRFSGSPATGDFSRISRVRVF